MTGTELTTVGAHKALASMQGGGIPSLIPQTIDEVYRFSQLLALSGLTPKGIDTAEKVTVQILMGFDLGLKPMQAVQNIAVINGKPSIGGDLALAILMTSGQMEEHDEGIRGEGDERVAWCKVKRKGMKEIERTFSVAAAKKAGLWDDRPTIRKRYKDKNTGKMVESNWDTPNDSPWYRFQDRMLCMRARGFAFRDRFSDVLKGMHLTEEMIGHEDFEEHEPMVKAVAPPPPPPPPPAPAPAPVHQQRGATPDQMEAAARVMSPATHAEGKPGSDFHDNGRDHPEVTEAEIVEAATDTRPSNPAPEPPVDIEQQEAEEAFDSEAWLDEVRDRFAEAQTEADVDSVHEMFGETGNEVLSITERQKYQDMHEAALKRVEVQGQPEAAEVTGKPGPAPLDDDDFPGNDAIAETAPPPKTPGEIYAEKLRAGVADMSMSLDDLSALWNDTKAERLKLAADGHITNEQVKILRAEVASRWETKEEPAPAPSAPPGPSAPPAAAAGEDTAEAYDVTFRERIEACQTVEEINALATSTIGERGKFSTHKLHKGWTTAVAQKRKQLTGIA